MKEIFTSSTYADLSAKIEEFMENHEVYDWQLVTIVTEKIDEQNGDYHWKATLVPKDTNSALVDMLGGATELAIKIKDKLVEMAIEDEIPSDMNELDYSIISDIIEGKEPESEDSDGLTPEQ